MAQISIPQCVHFLSLPNKLPRTWRLVTTHMSLSHSFQVSGVHLWLNRTLCSRSHEAAVRVPAGLILPRAWDHPAASHDGWPLQLQDRSHFHAGHQLGVLLGLNSHCSSLSQALTGPSRHCYIKASKCPWLLSVKQSLLHCAKVTGATISSLLPCDKT